MNTAAFIADYVQAFARLKRFRSILRHSSYSFLNLDASFVNNAFRLAQYKPSPQIFKSKSRFLSMALLATQAIFVTYDTKKPENSNFIAQNTQESLINSKFNVPKFTRKFQILCSRALEQLKNKPVHGWELD
jgi:hypothetical protein